MNYGQERYQQILERVNVIEEEKKAEWNQTGFTSKIFNTIFEAMAKIITALGDTIINVLQDFMLPGAPTAVAKRKYSAKMAEMLEERGNNDIVYAFYKKEGSEAKVLQSSQVPVPFIYYSPGAIFSNKVPALDVNFINESQQVKNPFVENEQVAEETKDLLEATELTPTTGMQKREDIEREINNLLWRENGKVNNNTAYSLQSIIAQWYVALRNIAILGLLIVIVFSGIRIVISSAAEQMAKYKIILKDMLIGLLLVLTMHYMMSFLLLLTQKITEMFNTNITIEGDQLMNYIRVEVSHYALVNNTMKHLGFTLIYIVMVWYTVMFTIQYIKRAIYIAFLTFIAPGVALVYPIEKLRSGQSRAFNTWFKEYVFNLILQPIHLVLYTIFVGSTIELAKINILYAIIAIGFLLEAEKFIKKMFGVEAQGGAGASRFAAGAIFTSMLNSTKQGASAITGFLTGKEDAKSKGARTVDLPEREANQDAPKNLNTFLPDGSNPNGNPSGSRYTTTGTQSNGSNYSDNQYRNNGRTSNKSIIRGVQRLGSGKGFINTGKKLTSLALRGFGAASLGMIGVSAGLASGELDNVVKLGALGVGSGWLIGRETYKTGEGVVDKAKEVTDTFQQGYYGEKYNDKIKNKKLDQEWFDSEETKKHFMTKYGSKWKEKREEGLELRKLGINDYETMDKAIRLKDNNKELTLEQAGSVAKLENVSRKDLINTKQRDIIQKDVLIMVGNNEHIAQQIMEYLDEAYDVYPSDLKVEEEKVKEEELKEQEEKEELREQDKEEELKEQERKESEQKEAKNIEKKNKEAEKEKKKQKQIEKRQKTRKHRELRETAKESYDKYYNNKELDKKVKKENKNIDELKNKEKLTKHGNVDEIYSGENNDQNEEN